ncbi:hypothetical protein RO3G_07744 [Rhizopus delemar RA 99-880]|uniref:Uncharacterized protein n=1 Tax=Rhizopus delemar (strain RA 99-880 / ATCC MYA-4621 / FGSC 9543 / NRRL 43880) TaxID=246409 RepID=I1C3K9_RHIO9|nr:hypothetical protein RO3G_07744 [Rhizopus delemar RA 99-880]|eukprot:EIE83039.1 hypothetical protein RO3G_07744 [Rhizopus delemar RA 99-880]
MIKPEEKKSSTEFVEGKTAGDLVIPFLRRPGKFNTEGILKVNLADYPGHFVIGIVGKQGVGHRTEGIDMYVTPERAILLDTEPLLSWTVLEKVLRNESLEGLNPDVYLEMDLLQRAELLKFNIPEYPLLAGHQDINYYPDIVFVCNKCKSQDFTWEKYMDLQVSLGILFKESELKTNGLIHFNHILPSFYDSNGSNVFLLPDQIDEKQIESFNTLASTLRNQVLSAPRKIGKKGQVSEKDWLRNAVKIYELVHKSDYMNEYLQIIRKLRDS